jgi:hypothetical protein
MMPSRAPHNEQVKVIPPTGSPIGRSVKGKMKKMKSCEISSATNTNVVSDPLAKVHSLSELTGFLAAETDLRKRDRKTAWSRRLDQAQWKTLKKAVLAGFNVKTPNKSIKLARKLLREGIASSAT